MSAGLALPGVVAACGTKGPLLETYERRLAADFGLTAEQQRHLAMIVERRIVEEREVFRNEFQLLPDHVQDAINSVRRREAERVRALLDPEQRRRFDAETANSSR